MARPEQQRDPRFEELRAVLAGIGDDVYRLPDDIRCELMRLAVVAYARAWEDDRGLPIAASTDITATEAVVAASGLVRSLNIELFELAMWQTQVGA